MGSQRCIEAISAEEPGAPMSRDDANLTFER